MTQRNIKNGTIIKNRSTLNEIVHVFFFYPLQKKDIIAFFFLRIKKKVRKAAVNIKKRKVCRKNDF